MAISASLLPFKSSKTSSQPNGRGDKPIPQPGSEMSGSLLSRKGLAINTDGTKKVSRKDKLNFFRRVSIRMSKAGSITALHSAKESSTPSEYPSSRADKISLSDSPIERLPASPSFPPQCSASVPELNSRESSDIRPSFSCYPTDSLDHLKDIVQNPPDSLASAKSRSSRASLFFWKRMNLSQSSMIQEEEIKAGLQEVGPPEDTIQTCVSSDGAPSSIMSSSEMSETMCSTHDTTETSVGSVEENENDDCGMAGIGIRNRNSISLHSLPVRYSYNSPTLSPGVITNKLPYHPGMRYAPSNSSPLSSRSHSPSEIVPGNNSILSNLNPARGSSGTSTPSSINQAQARLKAGHRLSSGRLNIVPNQSCIASEELMRILRGPSSYPEETLPRSSNDRNSLYLCV